MKVKLTLCNIISLALLVYYIGGLFSFVFVNSHRPVEYRYSENEPKLNFSFLDEVSGFSIKECKEINQKYGTTFDCATTPSSGLHVPYDKLPLNEKIEATLADFFKAVAGLVGRDFWSFRGMHIFLALCVLAPLVLLAGVPLLWRLGQLGAAARKRPHASAAALSGNARCVCRGGCSSDGGGGAGGHAGTARGASGANRWAGRKLPGYRAGIAELDL